jgi:demethylmenaquinone methyltransferase/2-methoxy-6-polyprenyl-1,4-benzoquinol methylase
MESPVQSTTKKTSWAMFDQIASTYDLTNRVLSGGQDVLWRRSLANFLPKTDPLNLLDLATGTGDQILHLLDAGAPLTGATGLDMSKDMLKHGIEKLKRRGLGSEFKMVHGDACQTPFEDNSFDCVTMSFGIRNVPDVAKCLSEMHRVLRPGGKALILEFALPRSRVFRSAYLMYFRQVLPRVGGLISGNTKAYRYLNSSVEEFPYGEAFANLMHQAGFHKVNIHQKTFGIANLYEGFRA